MWLRIEGTCDLQGLSGLRIGEEWLYFNESFFFFFFFASYFMSVDVCEPKKTHTHLVSFLLFFSSFFFSFCVAPVRRAPVQGPPSTGIEISPVSKKQTHGTLRLHLVSHPIPLSLSLLASSFYFDRENTAHTVY